MIKTSIVYEEETSLVAKFYHPKSDDYLIYKSVIRIKDSGKNKIEMVLKFEGPPPCYAPMPPKDYIFKSSSIVDLYFKVTKWFKKYGYILK